MHPERKAGFVASNVASRSASYAPPTRTASTTITATNSERQSNSAIASASAVPSAPESDTSSVTISAFPTTDPSGTRTSSDTRTSSNTGTSSAAKTSSNTGTSSAARTSSQQATLPRQASATTTIFPTFDPSNTNTFSSTFSPQATLAGQSSTTNNDALIAAPILGTIALVGMGLAFFYRHTIGRFFNRDNQVEMAPTRPRAIRPEPRQANGTRDNFADIAATDNPQLNETLGRPATNINLDTAEVTALAINNESAIRR